LVTSNPTISSTSAASPTIPFSNISSVLAHLKTRNRLVKGQVVAWPGQKVDDDAGIPGLTIFCILLVLITTKSRQVSSRFAFVGRQLSARFTAWNMHQESAQG